jgi:hypothetical protein
MPPVSPITSAPNPASPKPTTMNGLRRLTQSAGVFLDFLCELCKLRGKNGERHPREGRQTVKFEIWDLPLVVV